MLQNMNEGDWQELGDRLSWDWVSHFSFQKSENNPSCSEVQRLFRGAEPRGAALHSPSFGFHKRFSVWLQHQDPSPSVWFSSLSTGRSEAGKLIFEALSSISLASLQKIGVFWAVLPAEVSSWHPLLSRWKSECFVFSVGIDWRWLGPPYQ